MQLGVQEVLEALAKTAFKPKTSRNETIFCDKWYSFCINTSNSRSHIMLNSWENALQFGGLGEYDRTLAFREELLGKTG